MIREHLARSCCGPFPRWVLERRPEPRDHVIDKFCKCFSGSVPRALGKHRGGVPSSPGSGEWGVWWRRWREGPPGGDNT